MGDRIKPESVIGMGQNMHGFNFEPSQRGEYLEYLLDELIKKHAIIRSVSAGTLIATVLLMTALVAVAV